MNPLNKQLKIGIVGCGALGGYYGGMLANAGFNVHFLLGQHFEAVKKNGLKVTSPNGDFHLTKINAYKTPEEIGKMDYVFVGLKTTANDQFKTLITPLVAAHTRIISAQNGLGNEEMLSHLFGAKKISGALAFLCSNRSDDGTICHLDFGHIHLGNYQGAVDDVLETFCDILVASEVKCKTVPCLTTERWRKLMWNIPFNGLSTLLDTTVDKIMQSPPLRQRAYIMLKETYNAATALQLSIDPTFIDTMMAYTDKMTPYYTSMHLDVKASRTPEIESILGAPIACAKRIGFEMPESEKVYTALKEKYL